MRSHWQYLTGMVGVWALLAAPRPGAAQGLYQPARPTLSPWLNLYQQNRGPLDNYHAWVRPELELQNTLRQHDARLRFQGAGLQALGAEVGQGAQQQGVRPTGSASVFMNFSHYYPSQGQQPQGQQPQGPRPGAGHRTASSGQSSLSQSYTNRAMPGVR